MPDMIAACSWSSGKDSCLALHKAMQAGYQIKYLFNFISREYGRVSFHGTKNDLVHLQSEALGISLLQRETTKDNYEQVFRNTLAELRALDINQVVRGDIHLLDLKDWVKNVCSSEGIEVISPLWEKQPEKLLGEFIELGFKAVITCAQADKLSKDWVGRTIDAASVKELKKINGIDLCGEFGEYHTFVYDGPIFAKRINITKTAEVSINNFWFLDIQEYKLEPKGDSNEKIRTVKRGSVS